MTERLYYANSFLFDFEASVESVRSLADGRPALVLDRTAFYPTSGGQPFDTGWIEFVPVEAAESGNSVLPPLSLPKLRVSDVVEDEASGDLLHAVENLAIPLRLPLRVRGFIDVERRQDHMQQHSGQHILSAAFVRLFDVPTLSFHLGEQTSTIDLDSTTLGAAEVEQAERYANRWVWEDRQVMMHEVTPEQARKVGVRKLPETPHDTLRLIEIRGVDVCACGGTHVRTTGQVGNIQLRKTERVRQGTRVEFVCGERALRHARKDYHLLAETAALYSSPLDEVPAQSRKLIDSGKAVHRSLLGEVAGLAAQQTLARTPREQGRKIVAEFLAGRDLEFVKLYAQKLAAAEPNVIALLGAGQGSPALVFAQSLGGPSTGGSFDAGAELRALVGAVGGRGGGTRDLAQGGVPEAHLVPELIAQAAQKARALAPPEALSS